MSENILTIITSTLADVPAKMRATADQIEAGDFGRVTRAICVLVDGNGELQVFSWGRDMDSMTTVGLMTIATTHLARAHLP